MSDPVPSAQAPAQSGAAGAASAGESSSTGTVLGGDPAAGTQQPTQQQPQQQSTEGGGKPNEGKPGDQQQQQQQQPKAPDTYADFKVPEGMGLDKAQVAAFSPVMRKLNLSQEQAQELVDVYATQQQQQAQAFEKQLEDENFAMTQAGELLGAHRERWAGALKADKDIGGANLDANVKVAQKAIARFGNPALKQALNATGLGNHPEFVRFCLKVGQAISEDNVTGGTSGSGRKSVEDVFYGDQAAS